LLHETNVCNIAILHNRLQLEWCWIISSQSRGIRDLAIFIMSVPVHKNTYIYEC
jgi:hypothetical protein